MLRRLALRVPTTVLSLLLTPALAHATGQVWVVDDQPGPGVDFTTIQAAVDAAGHGDLVLVKTGVYPGFVVSNKDLALIAGSDQQVWIQGGMEVRDLAAGRRVELRGLKTQIPSGPGLLLEQNAGAVWIEECSLQGEHGSNDLFNPVDPRDGLSGAQIRDCASVLLRKCHVQGGWGADCDDWDVQYGPTDAGHGLLAVRSTVSLSDCTLVGSRGGTQYDTNPDSGGYGGSGARLEDGTVLYAAGSSFTGGFGGSGGDNWLGCGSGGAGGHGLVLYGTAVPTALSHARLLDNLLQPGSGGYGGLGCSQGPDGVALAQWQGSVTQLPGLARHCSVNSPVREQTNARFHLRGQAGDLFFAFYSPLPGDLYLPQASGSLFCGLPLWSLPLGTLPASGELIVPVPFGSFGNPALECATVYTQALVLDTGSGPWLTLGSALQLLDQSF